MQSNAQGEKPIAVDAMGSDSGPLEIVKGAVADFKEHGLPIVLVGDENVLKDALRTSGYNEIDGKIAIVHAPDVITMDDSPSLVIRKKPNSSIRVAMELVAQGEASSVVSAGNTGAMMAAGLYAIGGLPGIIRPAIASLIPRIGDIPPTVLIDSGANVECNAHQLIQFALMGTYYSRIALGIERPRVALLSNGSEISKGTDILRTAAFSMREIKDLNFVGYVEGRDLPQDVADVVVCDGFVGNIVLKAMEGSVGLVLDLMRRHVTRSFFGKVGLWIARNQLRAVFREKLDPSAYGGAPLLGLNCVAIVCHGASNDRAIRNAIRVARRFVNEGLVESLDRSLSSLELTATAMMKCAAVKDSSGED